MTDILKVARMIAAAGAAMMVMAFAGGCSGTCRAPESFGAVPSPQQLEWQRMETNMFIHFGPNTFTSLEWGTGSESEDLFNPERLDCRQWTAVAKAAGFKGIIITAKHHDGFCLWPNPESSHTVAQSGWRDGKGDVLKELSEACREAGLKFGVYVSPWDRNDPRYGTPEYNQAFVRTLRSIYSSYGEIFEQWFDGACGEGPDGRKQVYDWPLFNATAAESEPQAVIFSDAGPGCRWVGNERGRAGLTCWSTFDCTGIWPGAPISQSVLEEGIQGGPDWVPAECDVSIRPGWFWKESETPEVKSVSELVEIWYESVGRNGLLLLNVPPDRNGLIDPADSARLVEWRAELDRIQGTDYAAGAVAKASSTRGRRFSAKHLLDGSPETFWAAPDGVSKATVELRLDGEKCFNVIMLQEYITLGQRVRGFSIEAQQPDGSWIEVASGTTIGYKRLVRTQEPVKAERLRVKLEALCCPAVSRIALFSDL